MTSLHSIGLTIEFDSLIMKRRRILLKGLCLDVVVEFSANFGTYTTYQFRRLWGYIGATSAVSHQRILETPLPGNTVHPSHVEPYITYALVSFVYILKIPPPQPQHYWSLTWFCYRGAAVHAT